MRGEDGFTLIELVVGIALFVILANVLTVSFSDVDKRRVEQAAILLQNDLRYAQRMAVTESREYGVMFEANENEYVVFRESNTESGLVLVKLKTVVLENNVSLLPTSNDKQRVRYTPTGTTGDACTITLENSKYRVKLTVNVGAGRIDINPVEKL